MPLETDTLVERELLHLEIGTEGDIHVASLVALLAGLDNLYRVLWWLHKGAPTDHPEASDIPESEALNVERIELSSPGLVDLSGSGELIRELRKLLRDIFSGTYAYEKAMKRLDLIERLQQVMRDAGYSDNLIREVTDSALQQVKEVRETLKKLDVRVEVAPTSERYLLSGEQTDLVRAVVESRFWNSAARAIKLRGLGNVSFQDIASDLTGEFDEVKAVLGDAGDLWWKMEGWFWSRIADEVARCLTNGGSKKPKTLAREAVTEVLDFCEAMKDVTHLCCGPLSSLEVSMGEIAAAATLSAAFEAQHWPVNIRELVALVILIKQAGYAAAMAPAPTGRHKRTLHEALRRVIEQVFVTALAQQSQGKVDDPSVEGSP
jgi:hypothetical protein